MKIAATKVFADFINKTAANMGFQARAELVKLTDRAFTFSVDSWGPDWADWDPKSGLYKAIRVTYPGDFYACPVYLSTRQLCEEFRRRGVRDFDGLALMVRDMCEI